MYAKTSRKAKAYACTCSRCQNRMDDIEVRHCLATMSYWYLWQGQWIGDIPVYVEALNDKTRRLARVLPQAA